MILSDITIRALLKSGELVIEPMQDSQIQPASVDLRLGTHFLRLDENNIGMIRLDEKAEYIELDQDEIIIPPLSFLLATTLEYVKLPQDLTAFIEGRSSIGRMGLFIQNAGWVDPGFEGELTLEIYNANRLPIRLQSGRRIGQLIFSRMDRVPSQSYQGKYQGQRRAVGSMIYKDDDIKRS
ncbi:dCTP deaminase [candidate division KSB1 bacterium]|nr:dCTP deaminase [candidate division KSB1 bacterium]